MSERTKFASMPICPKCHQAHFDNQACPDLHWTRPQYDPALLKNVPILGIPSSTITVDRVPDWLAPTDLIEQRGKRMVAVSQTRTIPRWRHWLNKFTYWVRSLK